MLDLMRLAQQMQGLSQHLAQEAEAAQGRVLTAQRLMQGAVEQQAALVAAQVEYGDRMAFTAAQPVEPLSTRIALAAAPVAHTVIATDGSQISPSHHEIAYCYLINVGRVVLHYGQGRFPLLDSLPEVVYRPEDLYASRQWGISTEEWMGHRRTVAEALSLAELGGAVQALLHANQPGKKNSDIGNSSIKNSDLEDLDLEDLDLENSGLAGISPPHLASPPLTSLNASANLAPPILALVDGSLIYWFLETLPGEARDRILPPILEAWDRLRQLGIPLVGYLSASRSSEGLNFLRLVACPFPQPNCQTHCSGQSEGAPCGPFMPLRDALFWATELAPGQRSPFWRSSASILDLYGEQRIYFCYLNVGSEVARVEVPEWVMADTALCEMALRMVLTQVDKGYGYPVSLAEAHNQAVVRGGDRSRFFALLEQEMIRAGLKNVGTSYKEARKRGSIA